MDRSHAHTEHYEWLAAGATREKAREALADGFLRHLIQIDGADDALLRFGLFLGKDEAVPRENLVDELEEWYSINTERIAAGVCLRDMSPVPL